MYNDHEIALFFANAAKCPCYNHNGKEAPTCDIPNAIGGREMGRLCTGPEECPIYYWLKVTGILAKANFPMDLLAHGVGPK